VISIKNARGMTKKPLALRSMLLLGSMLAPLSPAFAGPEATTLPTGGAVRAGQAAVATSGANALSVNQSSTNAIIDWSNFSIARGASVTFNNGSGATLNRVQSGGPISTIDGRLSATGSVYLINPSGVIIDKDGVVQVGGTFAASTLDVDDSAFVARRGLIFQGKSNAAVVKLGKVEALGGDVVMAAAVVKTAGSVHASNGNVGVLAGYTVTIKDQADKDGLFTVQVRGTGTSVTNQGAIKAASAELRANGGSIYALAGNTGSVIKATEVSDQGGQIFLTALGGTVSVASGVTLDASGTGSGDCGHVQVNSGTQASTERHSPKAGRAEATAVWSRLRAGRWISKGPRSTHLRHTARPGPGCSTPTS
jgi:filamentous hemagglutinin family protein